MPVSSASIAFGGIGPPSHYITSQFTEDDEEAKNGKRRQERRRRRKAIFCGWVGAV